MVLHSVPYNRLLRFIGRVAEKESTRAYLVGGPLRDLLLGKRFGDLDIAVEGRIKPIGRELSQALDGEFIFYRDFNTGTIRLKNEMNIDLAQTRKELYPEPAALPRVSDADIIVDLRRRDFTVNAMALDLGRRQFGLLIDPYSGFADLLRREIRVLHDDSFIDDPTRIFRAVKFAVRLGFKIEGETRRRMRVAIEQKVLLRLSGERILHELELILNEPLNRTMLKQLSRVMAQLGFRLGGNFFAGCNRLARHKNYRKLMLPYLFAHVRDLAKYPLTKETVGVIRDLKDFPRREGALRAAHKPSAIYRLLNKVSPEALAILRVLCPSRISRKIQAYEKRYMKVKIGIGGEDLKRLGVPPGKVYKKILDELRDLRLDRSIRNRADEKRYLKKLVEEQC